MLNGKVKARPTDLAIFGGCPAFEEALYVGRPHVGDRRLFLRRVNAALDRRWLTNNGPFAREFEQRIQSRTCVEHAVAVCNATVGLEILARALGLSGEVIVPAFTFIATAHAFRWLGLTPVFCDVDRVTHNIDPLQVEALITPRTSAIVGVHLWGRPCEVSALEALSWRHGLKLIFDAAHAFGSSYRGRRVGGFGDAEVFSFHATKSINALEGGVVTTNDPALAQRVRQMRDFGFGADHEDVADVGTNGKMNEISAAMGLTLLDSMDDIIAANRQVYRRYLYGLAGIPGIRPLVYDECEDNTYHYIVLEVDEAQAGLSRDQLLQILCAENVMARRYFHPGCHRAEPYRSDPRYADVTMPVTDELSQRVLALPSGSAVGTDKADAICHLIHLAVAGSAQVRSLFAARTDLAQYQALFRHVRNDLCARMEGTA